MAFQILKSYDDSEDAAGRAVQSTLTGTFDSSYAQVAYLKTAVRCRCLDIRRSQSRQLRVVTEWACIGPSARFSLPLHLEVFGAVLTEKGTLRATARALGLTIPEAMSVAALLATSIADSMVMD